MPPALFRTLRSRIEALLLIALAPAFVLVAWNAYATRNAGKQDVQQEAYRLVSAATAIVAQVLESADRLFAAARLAADVTREGTGCGNLDELLRTFEAFENVGILSGDGRLRCVARPLTAGPVLPDTGWRQAARSTSGLVIGGLSDSGLGPHPRLVLARSGPARDVVLFATLDPAALSRSLQILDLPSRSSITMIDSAGTIVARHPDHQRWVGRLAATAIVEDTMNRQDGVTEAVGVDGVRRLYGFRRVSVDGRTPLLLTLGIPVRVAYAQADRELALNLGVLTLVTGVAYLLARRLGAELFGRKIESVLRAARLLSAGDLTARTGEKWTPDEIGELTRTFDAMAWTLEDRTRDLHRTVDSLRALAARLESVREEERTRISRELHDELGQTLTGIRMDLERLDERVTRTAMDPAAADGFRDKIAAARRLVDAATETARRVSRHLRPSVLDVLGFRAAVEWQLEEFRSRTGLSVELVAEPDVPDLPEASGVTLFRILQEALTNVMRHAGASELTVRLGYEEGAIVLEIMDNGRGFDADSRSRPPSLGLLGMRERAAGVGGVLQVTSAAGKGTTIHVSIPHPTAATAP